MLIFFIKTALLGFLGLISIVVINSIFPLKTMFPPSDKDYRVRDYIPFYIIGIFAILSLVAFFGGGFLFLATLIISI